MNVPQVQRAAGAAMDPAAIRAWRAQNRVSQRRLAALLNVGARSVYGWESGERRPPGLLGLALCEAARRLAEQRRCRAYRSEAALREKRQAWRRLLVKRQREARQLERGQRDGSAWW